MRLRNAERGVRNKKKMTNQSHLPAGFCCVGRVVEWEEGILEPKELSPRLSYLKIGLAGLGNDANWLSRWRDVCDGIETQFAESTSTPRWIAVAYADWEQAHAPRPQLILEAAIATHCAGFLIDTFTKDGRTLFDHTFGSGIN